MKVYSVRQDLANRTAKRIFVPQYSNFKIGVCLLKNGVKLDMDNATLTVGTTELEKSDFVVADYATWDMSSGPVANSRIKVSYSDDDFSQDFYIDLTVTDSTVFETDSGEGGASTVEFSGEYEDGETFSFTMSGKPNA